MNDQTPQHVTPCQPGHYHVRILRTASLIGTQALQLMVPTHARHDTSQAIILDLPADNPLHLAPGDIVILNMKQGGYIFEKDGQDMESRYLIHPGTLMFTNRHGQNHFMVAADDILIKVNKEASA